MVFRKFICIVLVCFLAGCASKKTAKPELAQEQSQKDVMTALESYVATSGVGSKTFIVGTKYGDVNVSIRSQYYAASGKFCRLVDVTAQSRCSLELAICRDETGAWKEAPVLWNGCGQ